MDRLTDKKYWEEYYSNNSTNREQIESVCSYYDKYWDILVNENSANPPKSIIEIGGHPGRYLAYLANKYNLIPTCLDFNSDKSKIEESMGSFKVVDYNIIQADIFDYKPTTQYDIVISNGFIEHFGNYDEVLDKHMSFLKPGGMLLVMIPNMRGYIKWYKKMVDKPNLDIHNLKCMNNQVFNDFAKRNNLEIIELTYFGGFPFSVHQKLNKIQNIIFQVHRRIFKFGLDPWIKKNPNKLFSSSLVAIFRN